MIACTANTSTCTQQEGWRGGWREGGRGGEQNQLDMWVVYNDSMHCDIQYGSIIYYHITYTSPCSLIHTYMYILCTQQGEGGGGGQNQPDMWVFLITAYQWMSCKEVGTNPVFKTSGFLIFIPHMTKQCIEGEYLGTDLTAEQSRVLVVHPVNNIWFLKGDFWGQTRDCVTVSLERMNRRRSV